MNRALFAAAMLISLCGQLVAGEKLTYEQHIRPIFRAHCFDCHGATDDLKGSLDLRQVRFMKTGGESGSVLDLDSPEDSYLVERIRSGEMPPGENVVSDSEIETIESGSPRAQEQQAPNPNRSARDWASPWRNDRSGFSNRSSVRMFRPFMPRARSGIRSMQSY